MKHRLKREAPHDGVYFYTPRWRTRGAPQAPSEVPWCTKTARRYTGSDAGIATLEKTFKKVRCPDCGRRLQLMTVDVECGWGDFAPFIPPHKLRELHARPGKKPKNKVRGFGARRGA